MLVNLSGFGALSVPVLDREGSDGVVAVCAAHYILPEPGTPLSRSLEQAPEQPDPPIGDMYHGPPSSSSLAAEGQTAYAKPATDIVCTGVVRAPRGQPVTRMTVGISVASCRQQAVVTGERIWDAGIAEGTLRLSSPRPFVEMPLLWERAYGGSVLDPERGLIDHEPRNPVGRGFVRSPADAIGKLVANIERPDALISSAMDRPEPIGFGPVARFWPTRRAFGGTYDASWLSARAPLWPVDFDERFFCSAPPALQARPHLMGGEMAVLRGFHAEGDVRFRLPAPKLRVRFRFDGRDVRMPMTLDGVVLDTERWRVTMVFRAAALAIAGVQAHRETVIRTLAPWE